VVKKENVGVGMEYFVGEMCTYKGGVATH